MKKTVFIAVMLMGVASAFANIVAIHSIKIIAKADEDGRVLFHKAACEMIGATIEIYDNDGNWIANRCGYNTIK